jgi:integrase
MRGCLIKRGRNSWRAKYDVGVDAQGRRKIAYTTLHGSRRQAEAELAKILNNVNSGGYVEPCAITVASYLRAWLSGPHQLAGKTVERYQQLAEQQIVPLLGAVPLQKLRPAQIADWHAKLLVSGGQNGLPISARTVGHDEIVPLAAGSSNAPRRI